ncbi:hypothetical protein [Bradyrhizobium yuanmingense]|uniref:hypothetical protein n=1 Tax=Bradyrhizobium yuanmingense TaxID=108015 RepID=UPI0035163569
MPRETVEQGLHGVGVDHEALAQCRAVANAESEALVAEQEIGAVEAIGFDPCIESLPIIGRGGDLEALAVHVRDRHAGRHRHLGAPIVEGEQFDIAS